MSSAQSSPGGQSVSAYALGFSLSRLSFLVPWLGFPPRVSVSVATAFPPSAAYRAAICLPALASVSWQPSTSPVASLTTAQGFEDPHLLLFATCHGTVITSTAALAILAWSQTAIIVPLHLPPPAQFTYPPPPEGYASAAAESELNSVPSIVWQAEHVFRSLISLAR